MIKIVDKPAIVQLGMFLDCYSGAYVTASAANANYWQQSSLFIVAHRLVTHVTLRQNRPSAAAYAVPSRIGFLYFPLGRQVRSGRRALHGRQGNVRAQSLGTLRKLPQGSLVGFAAAVPL